MLGQIALSLEAEVAVLAGVRPNVGVGADVLLEHRRLLAPDPAGVTDILPPSPAPDVGVIVISRLVTSLNCPHSLGTFTLLKMIDLQFIFVSYF